MAAFCCANLAVILIAATVCASKSNSFWNRTNCQFDLELEYDKIGYQTMKDNMMQENPLIPMAAVTVATAVTFEPPSALVYQPRNV